jgi:hypothetical protein
LSAVRPLGMSHKSPLVLEAAQEKDSKNADLEKQLGPQYRAVFDALYDADPNSKDVQDILSMFDSLDESCRH